MTKGFDSSASPRRSTPSKVRFLTLVRLIFSNDAGRAAFAEVIVTSLENDKFLIERSYSPPASRISSPPRADFSADVSWLLLATLMIAMTWYSC